MLGNAVDMFSAENKIQAQTANRIAKVLMADGGIK
jgi:hypothetical protein